MADLTEECEEPGTEEGVGAGGGVRGEVCLCQELNDGGGLSLTPRCLAVVRRRLSLSVRFTAVYTRSFRFFFIHCHHFACLMFIMVSRR